MSDRKWAGTIRYSEADGLIPHDAFGSQDIAIQHLTTGQATRHGARVLIPRARVVGGPTTDGRQPGANAIDAKIDRPLRETRVVKRKLKRYKFR